MKILSIILLILCLICPVDSFARGGGHGGSVSVRGYTRSDGTYVAPHTRSAPGSGGSDSSYKGSNQTGASDSYQHSDTQKMYTWEDDKGSHVTNDVKEVPHHILNPQSQSDQKEHKQHKESTTPKILEVPAKVKSTGKADNYYDSNGILRDGKSGKIHRSDTAKHNFQKQNPCPSTGKTTGACPGYVIDHVQALKHGGADDPSNMQWQTKADAKAKDKWE